VLDKDEEAGIESYERFAEQFRCASEESGRDQYLVPYFISGHPGSTLRDMVDLAIYLKKKGMRPRQVQDFIPTPMAMATCMYYTGIDPFTRSPCTRRRTCATKGSRRRSFCTGTRRTTTRPARRSSRRGEAT
jgi:radical SAM superfamily enzyme YgiQ (UPF0313 family)